MKRSCRFRAVPLILVAITCLVRRHEVHRMLKRVQRAMSVVDTNLAEIRRLRDGCTKRSDEEIAERTRREFDEIHFGALADYLQLKPERSKRRAGADA